jgi:hypothetical protein
MILADTSAWVEYDRGTERAVDRRLTELVETDGPVAVTEPVIMEVLAGARATTAGRPTCAGSCCASSCSDSRRCRTSTALPVPIAAAARRASRLAESWTA